jgi:predicted small metal-binding protein
MKEFSCGSVVPACTARFTGPTEADILTQVAAHASADHGMADVPDEVVAQVRANIVSVPA